MRISRKCEVLLLLLLLLLLFCGFMKAVSVFCICMVCVLCKLWRMGRVLYLTWPVLCALWSCNMGIVPNRKLPSAIGHGALLNVADDLPHSARCMPLVLVLLWNTMNVDCDYAVPHISDLRPEPKN
jgi:hypothetical protein